MAGLPSEETFLKREFDFKLFIINVLYKLKFV